MSHGQDSIILNGQFLQNIIKCTILKSKLRILN